MLLTASLELLDAMPLASLKTGLRLGDRRLPAEAGHPAENCAGRPRGDHDGRDSAEGEVFSSATGVFRS
jgi:hypothetical protein